MINVHTLATTTDKREKPTMQNSEARKRRETTGFVNTNGDPVPAPVGLEYVEPKAIRKPGTWFVLDRLGWVIDGPFSTAEEALVSEAGVIHASDEAHGRVMQIQDVVDYDSESG